MVHKVQELQKRKRPDADQQTGVYKGGLVNASRAITHGAGGTGRRKTVTEV